MISATQQCNLYGTYCSNQQDDKNYRQRCNREDKLDRGCPGNENKKLDAKPEKDENVEFDDTNECLVKRIHPLDLEICSE